jgi:hypothetical protein
MASVSLFRGRSKASESRLPMRHPGIWRLSALIALIAASASSAVAQQAEAPTREAAIEQEQAEKSKALHPYVPGKAEEVLNKLDDLLVSGLRFHPFFQSAYSGGGFTLGAGYAQHVGAYNMIDLRGSYTITNYKRIEAEFRAPRLFQRRGDLSVIGGWREATQVGFYGIGIKTSVNDKTNYLFRQPYGSATLTLKPTRRYLTLRLGEELSEWSQRPGQGPDPSVETVYTPQTLPGLGATARYLHSQGSIGFDWRTTPGYTRRGGYYGVTFHDYSDNDDEFGFKQVDYEVIQHFPILREAWVISLRGFAQTAFDKDNQHIPFFMLPSVGGGSSLRGFSSWRFRDRNSMVLQAEWRIMVNRFLDTAAFYEAGKVTQRTADFDLNGLKSDYGFGVRFHTPVSTPLRVEIARSNEGLSFVFSASAVF